MPKRDLLSSFLDVSESYIVILAETWLNLNITDDKILPDAHSSNIYKRDRIDNRGGGVLLGIKKALISYSANNDSNLEIVWAACLMPSVKLLMSACCRSPDSGHLFANDLRISITKATELCPTDSIYLLGDFNYPLINWAQLS